MSALLSSKFNTVNSIIKNSTSQIPTLGSRYLSSFGSGDTAYLFELSRLTAATFQAANSMDMGYSDIIRESVSRLQRIEPDDKEKQVFNQTLLSHARIFLRYVPLYRPLLQEIEAAPTRQKLEQTKKALLLEGETELAKLSALTFLLAVAFIGTIILVIYFLVILNRKHLKLGSLLQQLQEVALHDALTGLPSRFAYDLDHKEFSDPRLIIVNLDGFKHLNDFYGTDAGDYILKKIGSMLQRHIEGDDRCRLYRLGGDEFGVLMESGDEAAVQQRADNLVHFIEEVPLSIDGHRLSLGARAGCAMDGPLLEKADMALKQAKRGRRRVLLYSEALGLKRRVENNLRVIDMVKWAISNNTVFPYYQPILDLRTKKITRYECLIRIKDESGDIILPDEFLPVAQESNLYADLTRIMIEKSIDRFRDEPYGFSINLSIEDILDLGVTDFLFNKLEENPGLAGRMTLEILESEEVENYERIKQFVRRAQKNGCQVAIDDFGSGYSSLQHMLELKADSLKIDETLVRKLDQDSTLQLLVAAIMAFARGLSINTVTAEFVHNRQVLEVVEKQGIHYAQGFHIGKPEPELLASDSYSEGD